METRELLRSGAHIATIVSTGVLIGERVRDAARQRLLDRFNGEQEHIQAAISSYADAIELHADDIIATISRDLLDGVEVVLDDEDDDPVDVIPRTLRTYFAIRILQGYLEGLDQYYQRRAKLLMIVETLETDFSEVDSYVEKLLLRVNIDEAAILSIKQEIVERITPS